MKTIFRTADNIAGGDKIIVDGKVREVYDADYAVPEWESTIRIETVEGDVLMYSSAESIEVVLNVY